MIQAFIVFLQILVISQQNLIFFVRHPHNFVLCWSFSLLFIWISLQYSISLGIKGRFSSIGWVCFQWGTFLAEIVLLVLVLAAYVGKHILMILNWFLC